LKYNQYTDIHNSIPSTTSTMDPIDKLTSLLNSMNINKSNISTVIQKLQNTDDPDIDYLIDNVQNLTIDDNHVIIELKNKSIIKFYVGHCNVDFPSHIPRWTDAY